MGLAPELDPRLLVVCPRGPRSAPNGGFAWFDLNWEALGPHANGEQAIESRELLVGMLRELPEYLELTEHRLLLGGFSLGAMMSLGVGLLEPSLTSGSVSMSVRLLPEFHAEAARQDKISLPFLIQHGTFDQVLPIEGSRSIRDYLADLGYRVTYHEYPMGHEIGMQSLADIRHWLAERLQGIES